MRATTLMVLLALAPAPLLAASLADCAAIGDDRSRLACYDQLAGPRAPSVVVAPQAPLSPPAVTPAPPAPAPPAAPAGLGAEMLPVPPAVQEQGVHAHLLGEFTGWQRGTLFRLDNGQVWKMIGSDSLYVNPVNAPAVTVEKGLLSYWLQVEGTSRGAKVRRVE